MYKWQNHGGSNDTDLVFGGVDGSWFRRTWNPTTGTATTGTNDRAAITLNDDLPLARFVETQVGGGYAAQLDRVFWSSEGGSLYRRQCWGFGSTTNPAGGTFPGAGAGALRNGDGVADCAAPNNGTPWEKIMSDVTSLTLQYFNPGSLGSPLGSGLTAQLLAQTRVVEIELVMQRAVPNTTRTLEQRLKRRIWLENAGGLVTYPNFTSEALGGCNQDANLPNECNPQ
jgi:hypothetical protein